MVQHDVRVCLGGCTEKLHCRAPREQPVMASCSLLDGDLAIRNGSWASSSRRCAEATGVERHVMSRPAFLNEASRMSLHPWTVASW